LRHILSSDAIHNAMVVHAAFGGSTNLLLHVPAIAHAAGLRRPTAQDWIAVNRATPRLVDALPNGQVGHPTVRVFLAGGVRWMAEVFHDIEKNGCGEEERRFATADRQETCLAVLSLVAVRAFQLRCALQVQPDAPAEQVGTPAEIRLIRRLLGFDRKRLTVRAFVRGVAQLGGFLGRRHDGEPGVRALWRGYERLQDMVWGAHLDASVTDDSS
jgi:hypothetical protein